VSRDKGHYFNSELTRNLTNKLDGFLNHRFATTISGKSSRIGIGLVYKEKINKWKFAFRPQLQYTFKYADDGESSSQHWSFRTRLMASKTLPGRWEAYASVEPFFTFDQTEYFIDNIRNTIGLKHKFQKRKKIDFFYMYRPDFAKSYNRTFHIYGIKLEFLLK
jgi:hypothetical protein